MRRWRGPLVAFVLIVAFLVGVAALPTPADGAPASWITRAADRIPRIEHRYAATCAACINGNGHRFNARRKTGGYKGPYQYGYAWVAKDIKAGRSIACVHGLNDWRACGECSRATFMRGAARYGKRWVRKHWKSTCGSLR